VNAPAAGVVFSDTWPATKEMYGQQMYGKRAVTKTKLTLKQSHNRGTNPKPKADSHMIYCIGLSHSTQLYNKSQLIWTKPV